MMGNAVQASMTDVLSAVAGELGLALSACARLDGALGELLDDAPVERRIALMRELHAVDLLNQQIAALAGFLERLSGGVGETITVEVGEALGAVTLGEMATRLGRSVGRGGPEAEPAGDDIDFF